MRSHLVATLLLLVSPLALAADVSVAFRVKAPKLTPADAKLYLAGDAQALGAWKEDGVELKKGDDGVYAAKVALPADRPIEYKVTRGSWGNVEKNADGSEVNNRTFTPTRDATVDVEVGAWADQIQPETPKSTRTGDIRVHEKFASKNLGNERRILVWLPPGYEQSASQRYDVLYMHDGQNVFAHPESARFETWCANLALEQGVGEGRLEPWIIVAVDSGAGRMEEYSPWDEPRNQVKARGEAYGRFLVEHLKPLVDRTYRTRPQSEWTGAMGSSLGGLISLYLGCRYPEVFGRIGALSPTVMWSQGRLFQEWSAHRRRWTRIYLDAGEQEFLHADGVPLNYGEATRAFYEHLQRAGYADHEVSLVLEPGGEHHERDWQRRLPQAMQWLLG